MKKNKFNVRILFVDVETAPILAHVWGLFDQNIGLNQIKTDTHLLSWAAKWADEEKVIYMDQRNESNIENDRKITQGIWKLLNEADIVIGQNSKQFDIKRLNTRFAIHKMVPPRPFRQIDTLQLMKKHFALTSNKLAFASDKLCAKNKKSEHSKFSGFELWKACLDGNKTAWNEMKKYNIKDVLTTEELYNNIKIWDDSINFNVYTEDLVVRCNNCGSTKLQSRGTGSSNTGTYRKYKCSDCGKWRSGKKNLLSKEKKASLKE